MIVSPMSLFPMLQITVKALHNMKVEDSINDIIKMERIDKIDFLKLDINGYEDELFEKNTDWLKITNSIGFNNADINKTTLKIISKKWN